ncbi:hypothetical protein J7L01_02690, partial [bacterium]|nr:hypothetical protein [bacterium]
MKNTIIIFLAFLLLAGVCFAGWERTYGGSSNDDGRSVAQTTDGGYIVAGVTGSFGVGGYDVYLVKTDAEGDTIWTCTYGGSEDDYGYSVAQTIDGGYIVTGKTNSFGTGTPTYNNVYLIKTNSLGDTLWTRTYGGSYEDIGYSVAQTSDFGFIISGYTNSFRLGYEDVYLIKTNSSGDTLWTCTYGVADYSYGLSVKQTLDGGYIVGGYTISFSTSHSDIYLIKTNPLGDTVWTQTYGGSHDDYGYSVAQTTDGGYIIAGGTDLYGAYSNMDVYFIKTNSVGDTIWTKNYGGYGAEGAYSVVQTSDGGYIVAGNSDSFGADSGDVYLVKTDALGDTIWTRTYGGSGEDRG